MMTVQRAAMADGTTAYVFLNAMVTPVTATVQTIRNELLCDHGYFDFVVLPDLAGAVTAHHPAAGGNHSGGGCPQQGREYTPVQNVGYREIAQLNAQLTQTARDLRRVEEMQQELIANISHDLR